MEDTIIPSADETLKVTLRKITNEIVSRIREASANSHMHVDLLDTGDRFLDAEIDYLLLKLADYGYTCERIFTDEGKQAVRISWYKASYIKLDISTDLPFGKQEPRKCSVVDMLNLLAGSSLVDPVEPFRASSELIDDWMFFDTLIRDNIEEKLKHLSNWSEGLNYYQMVRVRDWTRIKVWERLHDNLRDAVSGLFKSDDIGLRASDSGFICSFIGKNTKKLLKTYLRAIRYTETGPFAEGKAPTMPVQVDNMDCIYAWQYPKVDELVEQINYLTAYKLFFGKEDKWFPGSTEFIKEVKRFNMYPTGRFIEDNMARLCQLLGSLCHRTVRFIRKGDMAHRWTNDECWKSLESTMHRRLMDRIAIPDEQANGKFIQLAYEKLTKRDTWSVSDKTKWDTVKEVMRLVRESAIEAVYQTRTAMP